MRFYTTQHQFYCGIDLYARSMYVCIVSHDGEVLVAIPGARCGFPLHHPLRVRAAKLGGRCHGEQ